MEEMFWQDTYETAIKKIERNCEKIGAAFPQAACEANGAYNREKPSYWTGGFWGGLLWMGYRASQNAKMFELACEIEDVLDQPLEEFVDLGHDVGFMWYPTAVCHYKMTGCEKSRIRGLKAASILASRFNINGRFIRAWNEREGEDCRGLAIIDCLMNLPLLYWASKELKDSRFAQIAAAYTDTALTYFVREDSTVPHVMSFDSETGICLGPAIGQGRGTQAVWSRGQAWALYGFAIGYRETGKKEYLETAKSISMKFMDNLPEDGAPYWDFNSEKEHQYARDSSASCIAASGMLEIVSLLEDEKEKEQYRSDAKTILNRIIENHVCFDDRTEGIVRMGTVNYKAKKYINMPIIYGDFFFVEALGKLLGFPGLF